MTGIHWENNPHWQTYFVHQGWNHELSQFAQVSDKTNRYCRYCYMYLFDTARWLFCRVRESNETVFPAKSGRRCLDIFGMAGLVLKLYCFAMQTDISQLMGAFAQKRWHPANVEFALHATHCFHSWTVLVWVWYPTIYGEKTTNPMVEKIMCPVFVCYLGGAPISDKPMWVKNWSWN